jgi:hypothetical protein
VTRPPLRILSGAKLRASLSSPVPRSAHLLAALQLDRAEDR